MSNPTGRVSTLAPPAPLAVSGGAARPFERLPLWSNGWRLFVAWLAGMLLFLAYTAPVVMMSDGPG